MKSLAKVFKIIELLKGKKGIKLQQITKTLDLPKSTTHRILTELIKNKYVYKDENNYYRLGYKFLEISSNIIDNYDLREIAEGSIDKLNEMTKETIHLAILLDNQLTYIDKRESQHSIKMVSQIGKSGPIYCTGVGKALLAFQPQEVIDDILANTDLYRFTKNTITSKDLLLQELSKIRTNGYAVDVEEHENHIGCIAAPIWNNENKVIGSISITAILINKKFEEVLKYKDLLINECQKISKRLGYTENE